MRLSRKRRERPSQGTSQMSPYLSATLNRNILLTRASSADDLPFQVFSTGGFICRTGVFFHTLWFRRPPDCLLLPDLGVLATVCFP